MTHRFTFFLMAAIFAVSCDKVTEPYDFELDDCPPIEEGAQKVLIEDLTGFRCTNCPDAHRIADNLSDIYCSQLIVVGVHCSLQFAYPTGATADDPYHTDFRTEAGDVYYEEFGNPGLPKGLVNRRIIDETAIISPSAWAEAITAILQEPPKANVTIQDLSYNENSRLLSFDVQMAVQEELDPGQYFMTIYLTEDSIYDWQLDNGTDVENYLHRHVLRDNINGTWGDLAFSNGSAGQQNTLSYTYTIDDNWKEEHCEIVAYIYNADTREIVQVDKKLVMNP